jgi:hypothetical protein
MSGAAAEGYATVTTDAGIPSPSPDTWALPSPGHVDRTRLQDFASVGLHDAALAAKSLITNFYGQGPKYSYWSGCSQGGRQGYMFAQQYPDVFDGIAAASPAINAAFLTAAQFPQQVMNEMKEYPRACELDALTTAAIKACDGDDGAVDGIISDPDKCHFSPYPLVGTVVNCSSISSPTTMRISEAAAKVADAAWNGARGANGTFLWYTPGHAANLTNTDLGVAVTDCSTNATCTGQGVSLVTDWIRLFVEKDAKFDVTSMSRQEYERVFRAGVAEYDTIIGTNSPDLSAFRKAGGKMITYHGQVSYHICCRSSQSDMILMTMSVRLINSFRSGTRGTTTIRLLLLILACMTIIVYLRLRVCHTALEEMGIIHLGRLGPWCSGWKAALCLTCWRRRAQIIAQRSCTLTPNEIARKKVEDGFWVRLLEIELGGVYVPWLEEAVIVPIDN